MNKLKINVPPSMGVTIIPNYFLDTYMPQANGEFVKIYLYLLRAAGASEFSLSSIADSMNCTEKDVMRALKYWDKEGLLTLTFGEAKKLEGITLLAGSEAPNAMHTVSRVSAPEHVSSKSSDLKQAGQEAFHDSPHAASAAFNSESVASDSAWETIARTGGLKTVHSVSGMNSALDSTGESVLPTSGAATPSKPAPARKNSLTADKIKQLKENEDIAQLLFIAEQYLGKTLTPMETNRILYFYDELGFSTDLIEYLIEYCVGNNHRSMNYIEKVAFNWKEQGIVTVEAAKKNASGYHKDYYTIFKALGIRNRSPIEAELATMKNWLADFSMELIVEACTRTVLTTKQPDLKYVNGILESWKKAGARTLQDVQKLDTAHEQAKSEKKLHRTAKATATRFSNFDQRAYDFDSLESQLLNQ